MELDINKLNREQKKAVTFGQGPVLIVAGAGTGKTTVITDRLVYLIQENKAKPEEILAVTFTDKAAEEMEERVDRLLSSGYMDLWISTFHSFCKKVLEENGLDIGLPIDFKLLDKTSAWLLVRQNLDRFKLSYYKPRGNPIKFIHALIDHFLKCKDQAIYPEDYLKYAGFVEEDKERIQEVAQAYKDYQDLLLENNYLDFGDLINYCLKLFNKRPLVLKKYRNQFKYILVDEFQDTNLAQYELIKILAASKNNLTVCADDKQAIYRFRGASYGNIVQFRKDFSKAKEIALINNYRSFQNILDLAYRFIQLSDAVKSGYSKSKPLIAQKKGEGIIQHLHFKTIEQEIGGVINRIIELSKKNSFDDFAILTRTNDAANIFSRACERANIPCQFVASKGLYSKPIILDIISYFKLLDNYHESSAVYRILNLPFLKILSEDIAKITQYGFKKYKPIYEALEELSLIGNISKETVVKVNNILTLIKKHTELANQKNVSEILLVFLEDSGYFKYLVRNNLKQDVDYINQFYKKIKEFEESSLDSRLKNFMEVMNLELEAGETGSISFDPDQGPEMVKIMTIHTAKGLEFKYVFLVSLIDKRFPSIKRGSLIEIPKELIRDIIPEGDSHLEEERRLFYVAVTRAKQGLFLTSADDYGGVREKKLSRFLIELGYNKKIQEENPLSAKVKIKKKKEKFSLPGYFSYTQLTAFRNCPLQYKFSHILRIPRPGRASLSFGKSMHNTLFDFVMNPEVDIINLYEKNWIDEWFENKKQRDDYYKTGKEILRKFSDDFSKEKPTILFINDQPAIEQAFNLKLGSYTIKGKIDRIDKIEDGVEIIDYKTGKGKDKLSPEDKQQLLLYQIVAEEVFNLEPKKLTYYYLDDNSKVSFLGKEQDKGKQKKEIISQIKKIIKSKFDPTPGWQCVQCDFKNICEFAQK